MSAQTFEEWKESYGLEHEPNYSAETDADCWAAWLASAANQGMSAAKQSEINPIIRAFWM